jgi:hypothetical protein
MDYKRVVRGIGGCKAICARFSKIIGDNSLKKELRIETLL